MRRPPHIVDELYGGNSLARPITSSNMQFIQEANFIINKN